MVTDGSGWLRFPCETEHCPEVTSPNVAGPTLKAFEPLLTLLSSLTPYLTQGILNLSAKVTESWVSPQIGKRFVLCLISSTFCTWHTHLRKCLFVLRIRYNVFICTVFHTSFVFFWVVANCVAIRIFFLETSIQTITPHQFWIRCAEIKCKKLRGKA